METNHKLEVFEYYHGIALARALMFRGLLSDSSDLSEVPAFVREYGHAKRELRFWRARLNTQRRKVHK